MGCLALIYLLLCLLNQCLTKPHVPVAARAKRDASEDDPPSVLLNVDIVRSLTGESVCYGGETAGLISNELRLEYRSNDSDYRWLQLMGNIPVSNQNLNASLPAVVLEGGCVEFRLIQEEHGGGFCNCWNLNALQLNSTQIMYVS